MDRFFSDVFGETFRGSLAGDGGRTEAATYHLPVNIAETDTGYRIQASVPGLKPEEVESRRAREAAGRCGFQQVRLPRRAEALKREAGDPDASPFPNVEARRIPAGDLR